MKKILISILRGNTELLANKICILLPVTSTYHTELPVTSYLCDQGAKGCLLEWNSHLRETLVAVHKLTFFYIYILSAASRTVY